MQLTLDEVMEYHRLCLELEAIEFRKGWMVHLPLTPTREDLDAVRSSVEAGKAVA